NCLISFGKFPEVSLPCQTSMSPCLVKSAPAAEPDAAGAGVSLPPHAATASNALIDAAAKMTRRAGRTKVIRPHFVVERHPSVGATATLEPIRHKRATSLTKR